MYRQTCTSGDESREKGGLLISGAVMVKYGLTWISGVACASVWLPMQDRLWPRGYDRLESGCQLGLLISSSSICGLTWSTGLRMRT